MRTPREADEQHAPSEADGPGIDSHSFRPPGTSSHQTGLRDCIDVAKLEIPRNLMFRDSDAFGRGRETPHMGRARPKHA
jgi:hypothetical protein